MKILQNLTSPKQLFQKAKSGAFRLGLMLEPYSRKNYAQSLGSTFDKVLQKSAEKGNLTPPRLYGDYDRYDLVKLIHKFFNR